MPAALERADLNLGGGSPTRPADGPDVDDESLDEFRRAAEGLSNALYAIELKRQGREQKVRKLII